MTLFYTFLFIHLVSLIVGFGSVIVIDTFGLLWTLKKVKLSQISAVANITQRLIWIGWCGLVLSGIGLITLKGYVDNLTAMKMFLVGMLGINGFYLHFIKKSMDKLGDEDVMPALVRFRITLASTLSQIGWWGAMTIGFLHRHTGNIYMWPPQPWVWMLVIAASIGIIAVLGELVLGKPKAQKEVFQKM